MFSRLLSLIAILTAFYPFQSKSHVFAPYLLRPNNGGPERFFYYLVRNLRTHGISTSNWFLGKCRVAFFMTGSPGNNLLRICRLKNVRTVVRVDGFYIPEVFDNAEHGAFRSTRMLTSERMAVNQRLQLDLVMVDHVIYQSQYSKAMADRFLYNRIDNFSIIYNGVDLTHFSPKSKRFGQSFTRLLVLGSLRDVDLLNLVLNVFRLSCSEAGPNFYLRIVGKMTPPVSKSFDAFVRQNEMLSDLIEYRNFVRLQELPLVIADCDIALHLKSGDACPNSVLEALACGVPVICQSWGGASELVGDAGIVIDHEPYAYDEALAKKAVKSICVLRDELASYRPRARSRAVSCFSTELMAHRYASVFKCLAQR